MHQSIHAVALNGCSIRDMSYRSIRYNPQTIASQLSALKEFSALDKVEVDAAITEGAVTLSYVPAALPARTIAAVIVSVSIPHDDVGTFIEFVLEGETRLGTAIAQTIKVLPTAKSFSFVMLPAVAFEGGYEYRALYAQYDGTDPVNVTLTGAGRPNGAECVAQYITPGDAIYDRIIEVCQQGGDIYDALGDGPLLPTSG